MAITVCALSPRAITVCALFVAITVCALSPRAITVCVATRHKAPNHATGIGKGSEGGEGLTYMTAIRHWLSGAAWTQRLKNAMRENEAFQIM